MPTGEAASEVIQFRRGELEAFSQPTGWWLCFTHPFAEVIGTRTRTGPGWTSIPKFISQPAILVPELETPGTDES